MQNRSRRSRRWLYFRIACCILLVPAFLVGRELVRSYVDENYGTPWVSPTEYQIIYKTILGAMAGLLGGLALLAAMESSGSSTDTSAEQQRDDGASSH